jgi:hypothetical protein
VCQSAPDFPMVPLRLKRVVLPLTPILEMLWISTPYIDRVISGCVGVSRRILSCSVKWTQLRPDLLAFYRHWLT